MAQLFAAHLVQKTSPVPVSGQYDPEQEVWVGDNQFQGVNPLGVTNTNTRMSTTTITARFSGVTEDLDYDPDTGPDTDEDEY